MNRKKATRRGGTRTEQECRKNTKKSVKYDKRGEEYRQFMAYLRRNTATSTMVATALGIYRPSTCRFKRWAEKAGQLWEVCKGVCAVTGYRASYLTTDPDKAPANPQTSLFDGMEGGGNGK